LVWSMKLNWASQVYQHIVYEPAVSSIPKTFV
jgi:hypothetical protein